MNKLKKTEIYKLIDAEIKWCLNDKNRTMPEDWHKGFIEGLKHAKKLIKVLPIR